MSIEKITDGVYELCCDECGEDVILDSFEEAVEYKRKNWKSVRHKDGEWSALCETCKEIPEVVRRHKGVR